VKKLTVIFLAGTICLLGVIPATAYNESPMLKVKVAAGELPPVEERVPEEPLVIEPVEEIGQYGGTAHALTMYPNTYWDGKMLGGWDGPLRIAPDCKTLIPNLVKSWEFSKDGKTLTLYLRKGIKWSDGAPFTVDDIMFWYEDVILNDELTPVKPSWLSPGGELAKVEKVNDHTVRFHFAAPSSVILTHLAHWNGISMVLPKHHLRKFHPRYTPIENLNEMAKKEGFDYWYQLYNKEISGGANPLEPNFPTLGSFMLTERTLEDFTLERNPYYWKVDPAGNQLPYIDKIIVTRVSDKEMYNAKIVTGEADFAGFDTGMDNYTLYKESAEKAKYRVLIWHSTYGGDVYYQPNQTVEDPALRKIFQDVRFRRALSLAIDREEINELIYYGFAEPRQFTVLPESSYYEEQFARAYAEYAPEEANQLLDEMGLVWDKNHEYRLRPDGKRLAWTIEYYPGETPKTRVSELVKEYWKEIGIDVSLKEISGEMSGIRYPGNLVEMGIWHGCGCTDIMFVLWPCWLWATHIGWEDTWCPAWSRWYQTKGEKGEEPPEAIKRLQQLYDEIQIAMDEKERIQIGKEACRIHAENVYNIGTVGSAPVAVIARENLRNIPESGLWGWDDLWTDIYHPEQFFFKQPLLRGQK